MTVNKGLKLVHLNIRSILKHRNEIEVTFKDYDIICLTESWLHCDVETSLITLPGFIFFRQDRRSDLPNVKKRGGGILIYINSKWAPYIKECPLYNTITADIEVLWLIFDPPNKGNC